MAWLPTGLACCSPAIRSCRGNYKASAILLNRHFSPVRKRSMHKVAQTANFDRAMRRYR